MLGDNQTGPSDDGRVGALFAFLPEAAVRIKQPLTVHFHLAYPLVETRNPLRKSVRPLLRGVEVEIRNAVNEQVYNSFASSMDRVKF